MGLYFNPGDIRCVTTKTPRHPADKEPDQEREKRDADNGNNHRPETRNPRARLKSSKRVRGFHLSFRVFLLSHILTAKRVAAKLVSFNAGDVDLVVIKIERVANDINDSPDRNHDEEG